jgi:DNA repair photolyase
VNREETKGAKRDSFLSMIREIQAKTLLGRVKQPDDWFGLRYVINLYRGCQHQCIYCDSRSECYRIDDFNHDVLVKANAIDLLRNELPRKRVKGTIGTGSMNDPYMPLEAERRLTRRALEVIAEFHFPVHVITKSDLVLRDLDLLLQVGRVYAAVTFTITAADDELSRKVEPGAPVTSRRLAAMKTLAKNGILTGVTLMPVLPFIEDNRENIVRIVEQVAACGAKYILPAFGMTLRDRQRAYYYDKLDQVFPGLRARYVKAFGERYFAPARNAGLLEKCVHDTCRLHGIPARMPCYLPEAHQPGLF